MNRTSIVASGGAAALAIAFLAGGITLSGVHAQQPPGTPPPTTQSGPRDPGPTGSIAVPDTENGSNEQNEGAALQALAKITADQAKAAALTKFPGATVKRVGLDNENGSLVYSVDLTDTAGVAHDVKVDAGNGQVLAVDSGETAGSETGETADGETAD